MGDQTVSNLSHSLSNEVIELVDANGLARDALARAHSHANPRPRNRPVKKENARLRKYVLRYSLSPLTHWIVESAHIAPRRGGSSNVWKPAVRLGKRLLW